MPLPPNASDVSTQTRREADAAQLERLQKEFLQALWCSSTCSGSSVDMWEAGRKIGADHVTTEELARALNEAHLIYYTSAEGNVQLSSFGVAEMLVYFDPCQTQSDIGNLPLAGDNADSLEALDAGRGSMKPTIATDANGRPMSSDCWQASCHEKHSPSHRGVNESSRSSASDIPPANSLPGVEGNVDSIPHAQEHDSRFLEPLPQLQESRMGAINELIVEAESFLVELRRDLNQMQQEQLGWEASLAAIRATAATRRREEPHNNPTKQSIEVSMEQPDGTASSAVTGEKRNLMLTLESVQNVRAMANSRGQRAVSARRWQAGLTDSNAPSLLFSPRFQREHGLAGRTLRLQKNPKLTDVESISPLPQSAFAGEGIDAAVSNTTGLNNRLEHLQGMLLDRGLVDELITPEASNSIHALQCDLEAVNSMLGEHMH